MNWYYYRTNLNVIWGIYAHLLWQLSTLIFSIFHTILIHTHTLSHHHHQYYAPILELKFSLILLFFFFQQVSSQHITPPCIILCMRQMVKHFYASKFFHTHTPTLNLYTQLIQILLLYKYIRTHTYRHSLLIRPPNNRTKIFFAKTIITNFFMLLYTSPLIRCAYYYFIWIQKYFVAFRVDENCCCCCCITIFI